jgi:hypothetical protein
MDLGVDADADAGGDAPRVFVEYSRPPSSKRDPSDIIRAELAYYRGELQKLAKRGNLAEIKEAFNEVTAKSTSMEVDHAVLGDILTIACETGRADIVAWVLRKNGVDAGQLESALGIATRLEHDEICVLLQGAGERLAKTASQMAP